MPNAKKTLRMEGQIFITGGSGFLGRAILRRARREEWPCKFTVFSRDEEKQVRVKNEYGSLVDCVLGDVSNDLFHLAGIMEGHNVIIHAAAIKFIPEAEHNVWETMRVNIDGFRNVIKAAIRTRTPRVVGISTDKASQPVNVYGMTKALMERCFAEANRLGMQTRLATVRYGNVVGSTGSIVPVFRRQLAQNNEVTVTDPNATRFWLSADEAIDMILLALDQIEDHPGDVFVPRCGAMSVGALARLVAQDTPVKIIGLRPGERAHEYLVHAQESSHVESCGDYFRIQSSVSRPVNTGEAWTYASHSPTYTIDDQRMLDMLSDAEDI